jgi:flagellar hook-basal body complex protein FliE
MSDPIGALSARIAQSPSQRIGQGGDTGGVTLPFLDDGPSFGDTLKHAINDISAQQDKASDMLSAFVRGDNVEVHQVMAASEEAQLSLEMLIEVRNKFTDAYHTLANMQA